MRRLVILLALAWLAILLIAIEGSAEERRGNFVPISESHTYKQEQQVSFWNASAFHFGMRGLNLGTTYWSESYGATESAKGLQAGRLPKTAGLALAWSLADTASQKWAPAWVTRFARVLHALWTGYGMYMDVRAGNQARSARGQQ